MVGAIILFVLASVTGGMGLYLWGSAGDDSQALRGVMFCVLGGVCLSGALIIDGLRFYASKVSKQIDWMVKRMNYRASVDVEPGHTQNLAGKNMNKYHVVGLDHHTGLQTELVVQAVDQTAALRTGEKAGIDVKHIEKTNTPS